MGRGFGVSQLIFVLAAAFLIAVPVLAIEESEAQKWYSAVENKPQADDTTQSSGLETSAQSVRTIVVDQSGKGKYKSVQKAIDSVPNGNKKRVVIVIRAGVYRSRVSTMRWTNFMVQFKQTLDNIRELKNLAYLTTTLFNMFDLYSSNSLESCGWIVRTCEYCRMPKNE